MKYILGAYVTSPCLFKWNPQEEETFFNELKKINLIKGLEHPFWGDLHPFDNNWFLNNISKDWDFVLTCIPGTMKYLQTDPNFGLASDNIRGRTQAIKFMDKAREAVININKQQNRNSVLAVHIASAPSLKHANVTSSVSSFIKSLEEISKWDWQNAKLVVEHCDAFYPDSKVEKGFLKLSDEIKAVNFINNKYGNKKLGITLNWGRSVIETKSEEGIIKHIEISKKHNLLKGLMFSGCSKLPGAYGVWEDTHMPPPTKLENKKYAETSLMTKKQIERSLIAADHKKLDYVGIKIMMLPNLASLKERATINHITLDNLDKIIQTL